MAKKYVSANSALLTSTMRVTRPFKLFNGEQRMLEVETEYMEPRRASPEDFAEAGTNWRDVEEAANRCFAEHKTGNRQPEGVVYLIAPKDASYCKIGTTTNPIKRLREIQICCWEKLYIQGLYWVLEGPAIGLEQLSLRVARKTGLEVRGEWVGTNPAGAAYIVGSAAHSSWQFKIQDSAMWVRQRDMLLSTARRVNTGLIAA